VTAARANFNQAIVSALMTEDVVDRFEVVDIHQQQRERVTGQHGAGKLRRQRSSNRRRLASPVNPSCHESRIKVSLARCNSDVWRVTCRRNSVTQHSTVASSKAITARPPTASRRLQKAGLAITTASPIFRSSKLKDRALRYRS